MQVTVLNTEEVRCSGIGVASDLFQTYYEDDGGTLTLSYTVNCGDAVVVTFTKDTDDTPVAPIVDEDTVSYEIESDSDSGKICDGIYCISLTYEPPETTTKVIEYGSTYVFCDTECKVSEEFEKDRSTSSMILYHDVIKSAVNCDTCNCDMACTLFAELQALLNGYTNQIDIKKFVKVEDCGCNKSN